VLRALKRLGATSAQGGAGGQKKGQPAKGAPPAPKTPEDEARAAAFNEVTEAADQLMGLGSFGERAPAVRHDGLPTVRSRVCFLRVQTCTRPHTSS
jgi:hypothetical protein